MEIIKVIGRHQRPLSKYSNIYIFLIIVFLEDLQLDICTIIKITPYKIKVLCYPHLPGYEKITFVFVYFIVQLSNFKNKNILKNYV